MNMGELLGKITTGISKKVAMNLDIPDVLSFSRRSSPRAEDVAKNRMIKKQETTRQRLSSYQSFDDAVDLLKNSENVVVLSGAGISTSIGIPDFRSDKGLYKRLSEELNITEPEEFFSNTFFTENPLDFFKHIKGVLPRAIPCTDGSYKPIDPRHALVDGRTIVPKYSPTHAFLTLLQSKGKLLTNYTQNIDGLELAAGVNSAKFIQCHGSWDTAVCMTCGKSSSARKYLPIAFTGGIPFCKCSTEAVAVKSKERKKARLSSAPSKKRKRRVDVEEDYGSDHSSDQYDNLLVPCGLLKPNITFFEDPITDTYQTRLESDKQKVDLLIVVGTSLKVAPIHQMLYQIPPTVPQIYISKERFSGALCSLPGVQVDIELLGEADVIIAELCRRAGWNKDLEEKLWEPSLQKIKGYVEPIPPTRYESGTDQGPPIKKIRRIGLNDNSKLPLHSQDEKFLNIQPTIKEEITITKQTSHPVTTRATTSNTTTITKTKTTTINTKTSTRSGLPIARPPNPVLQSQSRTQPHQLSTQFKPDPKFKSKSSSTSGPSVLTPEPTESKTKIELVEGTCHQWRISRIHTEKR